MVRTVQLFDGPANRIEAGQFVAFRVSGVAAKWVEHRAFSRLGARK